MDKQAPTTSVQHNDDYSKALIESYAQWMDGDTFQGSTISEEPATIETPIGTIPKPDFDKGTIPTIEKQKPDDGGTKDPKFNAGPPDSTKNKSSYGAQIKQTNIVSKEEVEVATEGKKAKKDHDGDGKIESGKAEYFGSKDKAIKKAMRKEELEAKLEEILTELSEMTETTFTITKERWEKAVAEREGTVEEEAACDTKSEGYGAKKKKTIDKIMGYARKK